MSAKNSKENEQSKSAQGQMETWTPSEGQQQPASIEKQDNLPANTVAVADAGTLKKKVSVTIHRPRIDAKLDEMFGELANTAQIPGFRIGHAPRRLIEKRFGKDVGQDVRNALLGEALSGAIDETKLKVIGEPDMDIEKIELPETGDMSFDFEVEIEPEFELPELSGIKIFRPKLEVTDESVDQAIENIRIGRARYEDTATAAKDGDAIIAGAKISGKDIEAKEFPGLTIRVAPGQIEGLPLMDLGEKLTGVKAGATVKFTATAPKSHVNEDWREKELTVEVTVSQVRSRILPELNDEFAKSIGFDSMEDMKKYMHANLTQRLGYETQREMHDQLRRYLTESTKFDLPEGVVARHTGRLLQRRYIDLLQRGIPKEKIDENLTELQAAASEQAQFDLKMTFILGKVAEKEEISVNEEEVNARIAQMASIYNRRPERLRQELAADGSLDQVQLAILEEKTLDKLMEKAKIEEGQAPEAKESKKPAAKKKEEVKEEKSEEPKKAAKAKKDDKEEAKEKKPAKKAKDEDDKSKSSGKKKK